MSMDTANINIVKEAGHNYDSLGDDLQFLFPELCIKPLISMC